MSSQPSLKRAAPPSRNKSIFGIWFPFGLWRIDWYYVRSYVKAFLVILVALSALVAIGDMFSRFDDFVTIAREEDMDLPAFAKLFGVYYGTFVPQLVFQYMLPVIMLLAASITVTASFAGPRGNNEYVVIRSAGVPVLRAFFPLIFPAFVIALAFQATRDHYLPAMVRESSAILGRLRNRTGDPTSVSIIGEHGFQTAAVGWFAPGGVANNLILEVRDPERFRRGEAEKGDNDFTSYRAALARLVPVPGGEGYQWMPEGNAEAHLYTRFSRRSIPWTQPVPSDFTPAMIERQTLGDAVCSWRDLLLMRDENAGAQFELFWRIAEPLACAILIMWGTGLCMGRMLRGRPPTHIQAVTRSMIAGGLFYALRLAGKGLWESGTLSPRDGVLLPLAAAAVVAVGMAWWMER